MKKLIGMLVLFISFCSQATLITLTFDKAQYQQGELIQGQLIAHDLNDTLGGFAGEIAFDHNQLALETWQFGSGFDDGFGSYSFADDSISGRLSLEDYADFFADEVVIASKQGTSFVLASFTFTALTLGVHSVSLLNGLELISFDNATIDSFSQMSTNFSVVTVDEPHVGLLFALTLVAVFFSRSRRRTLL